MTVLVVQTDAPSWDSLVFERIDEVDIEAVSAAFGTVEVVVGGRAAGAVCPDCGRFSDRVHDRYQRRLKGLPLAEQGFVIRLMVRRFICGAADVRRAVVPADCPVRTVCRAARPRPGASGARASRTGRSSGSSSSPQARVCGVRRGADGDRGPGPVRDTVDVDGFLLAVEGLEGSD
ncbi:transposase family protein, partial [Streptomyces sp. NPDC015184]|uniref:transposase family protein n=1 Tax=Streptomyces sp. NPDC015184 TaxID=3364946 RepID=UPI00370244C5